MRKDMAKRFLKYGKTVKGRFPRNAKRLKRKDEDGQELESPHGMKKIHRLTNKWDNHGYLGSDFSVLERFLHSRKGQPWDKVYSEICAEADERSFEGHHLREYIPVEMHCTIEDGKVYDEHGHQIGRHWGEFYVHPETQILEYIPKLKPQRPDWPPHTVFDMDGNFYHEHQEIWYRVEMKEIEKKGNSRWNLDWPVNMRDVFVDVTISSYYNLQNRLQTKYGNSPDGKIWYCVKKESANSREISKLKKKLAA